MKAKFLTTILLLISVISFAQNQTSEHLTFKNIPIDGTLTDYVSKMKLNGFTQIGTESEKASLKGDFAGYKDCRVIVSTLKQKDLVHKVGVIFPKQDTWATLSGNYFELKKLLTEKYGEPFDVIEKFDSYTLNDDGDREFAVGDRNVGEREAAVDRRGRHRLQRSGGHAELEVDQAGDEGAVELELAGVGDDDAIGPTDGRLGRLGP